MGLRALLLLLKIEFLYIFQILGLELILLIKACLPVTCPDPSPSTPPELPDVMKPGQDTAAQEQTVA